MFHGKPFISFETKCFWKYLVELSSFALGLPQMSAMLICGTIQGVLILCRVSQAYLTLLPFLYKVSHSVSTQDWCDHIISSTNKSTKILCNQDSQDILSKNNGSFVASAATYRLRVMIVIMITGTEIELWKHSKPECGNIIIWNRSRTCTRQAGLSNASIFGFLSYLKFSHSLIFIKFFTGCWVGTLSVSIRDLFSALWMERKTYPLISVF